MKTKILSLFALSTLLFASCSSDGDAYDDSAPKPVQFTSKVEVQGITTRVKEPPAWKANDAIGIYMLKYSTDSISETAENKRYVTAGDGDFSATGTNVIYYPVDATKKVDFIAYYPHSASVSGMIYPVNLVNQTNQSAIDFMYATKVTNKDKSSTSVNLNFSHKLVKVELFLVAGTGILESSLSTASIRIKNVNTLGSVDLKTGTLTQIPSTTDIIPVSMGGGMFEAILLPRASFSPSNTIEFTIDGNTYVWTMSNTTGNTITSLAAGNKYRYTITINKTGVGGVNATISEWVFQNASGIAS